MIRQRNSGRPVAHRMIQQAFGSQLRRNMILASGAASAGAVITLVTYPIYLHFLGYKGLGLWLAMSIIIGGAQVCNLGIPNAVAKIVAERQGAGDIYGVTQCLTNALAVIALLGLAITCGASLARNAIVNALGITAAQRHLALVLLPFIVLLSAYAMWVDSFNAALVGLGRMDITSTSQAVTQACGAIVTSILLTSRIGIASLLIGTATSFLILNAVTMMTVRRILGARMIDPSTLNWREALHIVQFGGWLFGGSAANLLLSPFNKVMLARYAGVDVLPIYEMAFVGAMRIRGFVESGLRALMPEVSSAMGAGAETAHTVEGKIARASLLIRWIGLPVYGALFAAAPLLLRCWLRQNLRPALPGAFRMMLAATFVSLLSIPSYYKLLGCGRVRVCFLAHVLQAGTNVMILLSCIYLRHSISIVDTCWAIITAMTVASTYVMWQGRREMKSPAAKFRVASGPEAAVVVAEVTIR